MNPAAQLQQRYFRWALRGRAPEASPIVLGQRRVFVLPTRGGIAYAVSLALMLIGAINYNLSLGYAMVFLLAGLGVTAIFHTFRNLAHLQVSKGRCEPVFAGDKALYSVVLANFRATSRPAISLRLAGQTSIEIDIPGAASVEAELELPAPKRGWLALPRIRLSTTYPLGLIRAWAYAAPQMRCLVYPAPARPGTALPAVPGDDGGSAGHQAGMEDFAGLRGHQPADPLRRVAWKAAARRDEAPLLTKLFAGAAAHTLWLEWDAAPAHLDVEARLSLLTRWICEAHEAGFAWGLRLPGTTMAPATGASHYRGCLEALALYD